MSWSEEVGQGSELRRFQGCRHMFQRLYWRPVSLDAGGCGAGAALLTRSLSVAEVALEEKGFKAESALVDQMELPKGVGDDHGLRPFPRSDAVGAVGELGLLGQGFRSRLATSQMEEGGTDVNSGQLCCGSNDFG